MGHEKLKGFGRPHRKRLSKNVWIGRDHILISERLGSYEEFVKIQFKDIKGILRQKAHKNWVVFSLFALMGVPLLLLDINPGMRAIGCIIDIILVWLFIINRYSVYQIITAERSIRISVPNKTSQFKEIVSFFQDRMNK